MSEENTTLYLYRTGVTVTRNGAIGERGKLEVGSNTYHTIERRGGYVTLKSGTYEIKMEYSPSNPDRKQFRIYEHGVYNNKGNLAALLIHAGNYPGNVTGCIAPGKTSINNGVGQSTNAMNEIFNYLGGFAIGKTATLVVSSYAEETKKAQEQYIDAVKAGAL